MSIYKNVLSWCLKSHIEAEFFFLWQSVPELGSSNRIMPCPHMMLYVLHLGTTNNFLDNDLKMRLGL